MEDLLRQIGLTALMDYLRHFWHADQDGKYLSSVYWDDIQQLYEFNEQFISLTKTVGDKVETAFREQIAYQMEQAYGCYWHYDKNLFKEPCEKTLHDGQKVIHSAYQEIQNFTKLYFKQTGKHPFRRIMYKITFRQLFHVYTDLKPSLAKERIAEAFGIPHIATFESSMYAIEELRNLYSHLTPIWVNRYYKEIRYCLHYPSYFDWLKNTTVKSNNVYYRLCLLNYFLRAIESDYPFPALLYELLEENSNVISSAEMGFTEDWTEEDMWNW